MIVYCPVLLADAPHFVRFLKIYFQMSLASPHFYQLKVQVDAVCIVVPLRQAPH